MALRLTSWSKIVLELRCLHSKFALQRAHKLTWNSIWLQTSYFGSDRNCQGQEKSTFYVTTPIFYVNASPHIGHLYTALVADSLIRWNQLKGKQTLFATGTDEHGLKIQQAADKAGLPTKVYCDQVSATFKELFKKSNINYSTFIRTTDETHVKAVHHLWNTLDRNGFIYKGSYKGWYCVSDEAFLSDNDVMDIETDSGQTQKVSKDSGHPVVWTEEDNYMFRLSHFRPQLLHWLDTNKGVIQPSKFERIVRSYIECLSDLSVSRSRDRLSWGIPVPNDSSQVIYVWLDALTNYLTVTGYPGDGCGQHWPADCQVVGQDILKFHAVYWPAFLLGAGLPLPKKIICHSHWTVNGVKMSKSLGNIVDPLDCISKYTVDGIRFFLLREATPQNDSDYDETRILNIVNSELVNTLGNLLSRSSGKVVNPAQVFPNLVPSALQTFFTNADSIRLQELYGLADELDEFYENGSVYLVVQKIVPFLFWTNKLVNDHEPWVLVKTEDGQEHLDTLLYIVMETLRVCGILLQPVIPDMTLRLLNRLGVPESERGVDLAKVKVRSTSFDSVHPLGPVESVLIKRIKAT